MTAHDRERWGAALANVPTFTQLVSIRYAGGTADARHPLVPTVDVPAELLGHRYGPPVDAVLVPLSDRKPGERFAIAPAAAIRWHLGRVVGERPSEISPEETWPVAVVASQERAAP